MRRVTPILIFVLTSATLLSVPSPLTFGREDPLDIHYWSAPDHTRIVIYIEEIINWNIIESEHSNRLIVEIHCTGEKPPKGRISVSDPVIREIQVAESDREMMRLHIFLVKPAEWDIFTLEKYLNNPAKMVMKISRPDLVEQEKRKRAKIRQLHEKGTRIIVVDPGHGAEDQGAIGRNGTREKDVVLKIAKEMQKVLNKKSDFKAALTRSHDYFIPLEERINIAQEYGADLFISLHADWTIKKDVRGTSFYCLSLQGASDKGAELLAEKENLSDFIGGVPIKRENEDLQTILLDLVQTKTINDSLRFAGLAIGEMSKVNKIKYNRPKQASFGVLKSPNIPSVLVEMAYLSNQYEERLLNNRKFQFKFAEALSHVAVRFLTPDSLETGTVVQKKHPGKKNVHIVQKGENLWSIASKYGIRVSDLQKLNHLKDIHHIIPGKKLLLP
ncbi:MAG: N-acetylmuramoyl-L-alanine amidase [Thermodesulfobacteriota bacterium]|nr:N-acetylmuramoyl-L-alanine amidase [Thermodesulfobacteriota bacterium]